MYILIEFTNGTIQREFCDREYRITKDRMLMISKGDYSPSLFINMDVVKMFQEVEN